MRAGKYSQAEAKRALANVGLLTIERDNALEQVAEAEASAARMRALWTDEREVNKRLTGELEANRLAADHAREMVTKVKLALAGETAQRMKLQGYIEGMLDGTHPRRPKLPWETERRTEGRYVGNVGEFRIEE